MRKKITPGTQASHSTHTTTLLPNAQTTTSKLPTNTSSLAVTKTSPLNKLEKKVLSEQEKNFALAQYGFTKKIIEKIKHDGGPGAVISMQSLLQLVTSPDGKSTTQLDEILEIGFTKKIL